MLILPNIAILSESQEKTVRKWLADGKDLILTSDTALYDTDGEWKGTGELHRDIGIDICGKAEGISVKGEDNWLVHESHTYLEITCPEHPVFCKTPDTELLPFGGRMRICTSHGKLEPICNFIPAFPIYPPEFSWIREKSGEGAVYAGILESGSRVVYFAADIDRCYSAYHIPDHHRLLEGAVRWAGGGNFPVTVQAPAHVNCNVYRQEEQYLIQLVNLAGCNVPLGTLEESLPIGPVKVTLQGFDKELKAVSCISGKHYEVMQEKDDIVIMIPRLEEQEIIRVNK